MEVWGSCSSTRIRKFTRLDIVELRNGPDPQAFPCNRPVYGTVGGGEDVRMFPAARYDSLSLSFEETTTVEGNVGAAFCRSQHVGPARRKAALCVTAHMLVNIFPFNSYIRWMGANPVSSTGHMVRSYTSMCQARWVSGLKKGQQR